MTSLTRAPMMRCPLRPGQPCTLCHPDARSGPQDCPTVAIVMGDDELRAELAHRRAIARAAVTPERTPQ